MSDKNNSRFIEDPEEYIKRAPIDPLRMIQCVSGHMDVKPSSSVKALDTAWVIKCQTIMAQWSTIVFDLYPQTQTCADGVKRKVAVLRIDQRSFTSAEQKEMLGTKEEWKKFDKATNPIQGYWFPYNVPRTITDVADGVFTTEDMGWVDIPKQNPDHKFAFTGGMNGCALVITESPAGTGNDHWRVYHYPNVSSYPKFKDLTLWPRTVRGIYAFQDYGGTERFPEDHIRAGDIKDPASFNFLYYKSGEWYVASQPHTWHTTIIKGTPGITMTSIRTKTINLHGRDYTLPGLIPISHLRRTFPA